MSAKDMSDLCTRTPSNELVRTLQHRVRTVRSRGASIPSQSRNLPEIRDLSDFGIQKIELPPQIINGVLHKGSTMVFGGGSKTNKTFCLMDLALSVSQGIPWWSFETTKGKVLYVDFELQQAFFDKRLRSIVAAKEIDLGSVQNLRAWNMRGHASDIENFTPVLLDRVRDQDYSLIILDPIYKALGYRDENKAGDINSLFNEIDKIAVDTGAAIILGHHFTKGNQAGKESMDRISGSGVFGRSPDSIMIITKHEQESAYTVEGTLRNSPPLKPFCVRFEHPLMVRDAELDPRDLKKAGAGQKKYSEQQLIEALDHEPIGRQEWFKKVNDRTKMSERTFDALKKKLPKTEIKKDNAGRWMRVRVDASPLPVEVKDTTTNTAEAQTTAIAPAAIV